MQDNKTVSKLGKMTNRTVFCKYGSALWRYIYICLEQMEGYGQAIEVRSFDAMFARTSPAWWVLMAGTCM